MLIPDHPRDDEGDIPENRCLDVVRAWAARGGVYPHVGRRSAHGLLALCAALLTALGCGRSARIAPLTPASVVVAFGDSLTAGVEGRSTAYPAVLGRILGVPVVNAGESGETSADGLRRLPGVLDEHAPQLVILCHGGNDFLGQRHDAQTAANLDRMVRLCRDRGADVLLLGVPAPSLRLRPPPFFADLARRHNIPYDGVTLHEVLGTRSLKSDSVHPNAAGNRRIAEAIAARIATAARR